MGAISTTRRKCRKRRAARRMRPPRQNRLHPMAREPGVVCGPMFNQACQAGEWKPDGPRVLVKGRWLSCWRASKVLFVSQMHSIRCDRSFRLDQMRYRIGQRLGKWDDFPF